MKKGKSIVFKLSLFISVILILFIVLTYFVVITVSRKVLDNNVRDYLISTVEQNVGTVRFAESENDMEENIYYPFGKGFVEIDTDFLKTVSNVHSALYTEDGELIYGETPVYMERPFTETYTYQYEWEEDTYQVYDRAVLQPWEGEERLWIRGIVSKKDSDAQLTKIATVSLISMPLLIILAIAGGYILARNLLRPLSDIRDTAVEIATTTDLSRRIDIRRQDEIGNLAGSLNTMMDRLQDSFENEKQFTSDVSHELRTPVSVILSESEYMLEKQREIPEYIEAMEVIHRQGSRMSTLVNDMLSFARLDQGIESFPFSELDLSDLTKNVAAEYADTGEKSISLKSDIRDGIHIYGSSSLVERLLRNLVDNALKYGRDGGYVKISLKEDRGDAVLSVEDDGIGISEEDQKRIFDRFYRADSARSEPGTGLGLSMVRKIADLHGADVELSSREGQGSRFTIIFRKN